jgi:hypothetical protein
MGNSLSYLLQLTREIFGINPLVFLLLIGDKYSLNKIEKSDGKIQILDHI